MFTGLSAFPLTPMSLVGGIDEPAFCRLVERLSDAGVDSIGALGSTGSYAYLSRAERAHVVQLAVRHAGPVPVMVGIGSPRTDDVLRIADDAQRAGASGVLLAPVSYQPLTAEEVFGLFETVTATLSVPLCVYDNPGTTRFEFTDELHAEIARLPNVRSIKIPGVPTELVSARKRIARLRALIPETVSLGISDDACAANGLNAGCDGWYSVIGGLFPEVALRITRAAKAGRVAEATDISDTLRPLWSLFDEVGGSLRVIAAAAELLGLAAAPCLPRPLKPVDGERRRRLASLLDELGLS